MDKKTSILAAVLLLLCIGAGIFYTTIQPKPNNEEKTISVTVCHADKTEHTFTYQTTASTLADVLLQEKLVEGKDSAYGLFILTVDGETADSSRQQWWCITKNAQAVTNGADTLPIADGDHFTLTLLEGYE